MLLFLVDLINIEIFRISFSFFYSFSFILCSRATSTSNMDFISKMKVHKKIHEYAKCYNSIGTNTSELNNNVVR